MRCQKNTSHQSNNCQFCAVVIQYIIRTVMLLYEHALQREVKYSRGCFYFTICSIMVFTDTLVKLID